MKKRSSFIKPGLFSQFICIVYLNQRPVCVRDYFGRNRIKLIDMRFDNFSFTVEGSLDYCRLFALMFSYIPNTRIIIIENYDVR